MTEQKSKPFVEQRETTLLPNPFTFHLMLYIFCVILTFWDMLGWQQYHQNTIRDRAILFAGWGVVLLGHYIYLCFFTALNSLQRTVEHQRHALATSLFTEEERVNCLKK